MRNNIAFQSDNSTCLNDFTVGLKEEHNDLVRVFLPKTAAARNVNIFDTEPINNFCFISHKKLNPSYFIKII